MPGVETEERGRVWTFFSASDSEAGAANNFLGKKGARLRRNCLRMSKTCEIDKVFART